MHRMRLALFVLIAIGMMPFATMAAAQTAAEPSDAHQELPFNCPMVQTVLMQTGQTSLECDTIKNLKEAEPHWAWIIQQQVLLRIVERPDPETINLMVQVSQPVEPVQQASATSSVRYSAEVEQWRPLVSRYFAPGDVNRALRILSCESNGDPNAANPSSGASGLFQHMPGYWSERSAKAGWAGASVFDPQANVAVAAWLAYSGGWGHWVCK